MRPPTDQQALAVGRAVLALVEALGLAPRAVPSVYTNRAAETLPPDAASADAFARVHRAAMRAGTPGWTKNGSVATRHPHGATLSPG